MWVTAWTACGAGAEPQGFPEFKPEAARDYVQNVVQGVQAQTKEEPEGCFIVARVWNQLGQKEEAERLAKRALKLNPNRAEIQFFLAGLFIHQDRMEEAAICLRRTLALKPDARGASRQLGMVLDRLGDREGARKVLETAILQAPEDATARLVLGRLLFDQGQIEDARLHLERACQLDPNLSGAFYALSQTQGRLGQPDAARESLKTFQMLRQKEKADLDARNTGYDDEKFMRVLAAGFHTEVGEFLLQRQQPDRAEAHLRQAMRVAPQEARAYEVLAAWLVQKGRLHEARGVYEDLVRLQPGNAGHRLNLGTLQLQLQDYPAAVEELKRALELDPRRPEVLNNLARYYLSARRNLPEALALAQRLVDLQPTAASYDLLGWASYANGRTNEARAAAAQAVEKDPTNTVYRERYQRLQTPP